jgi:cystathionine beta-lyase/cystathionine gamma-synthase
MSQKLPANAQAATVAVRAALDSDTQHGAVVPPIHLSSTYTFAAFGERRASGRGNVRLTVTTCAFLAKCTLPLTPAAWSCGTK